MAAVRAAPLFGLTLNVTVPLPVPEAPPVTTSHDAFDVADHAQPSSTVTSTEPLPPSETTLLPGADSVPVHGGGNGASCDTVTVFPAIVTVPVRTVVPSLAATVNDTLPLPDPEAPLATAIQAAFEVADQEQVSVPLTAIARDSPPAAADAVIGDTE